MGGLFGGGSKAATKSAAQVAAEQDAAAARARAEERAESSEISEMQGIQKRRRLRRVGGMRLLFSPYKTEGPNQPTSTLLGGGD
jgi:hypothetical protein